MSAASAESSSRTSKCSHEYGKPKNLSASGKTLVLSLATSLTHSRTLIDLPANIAAQRSKTANGAHRTLLSFL